MVYRKIQIMLWEVSAIKKYSCLDGILLLSLLLVGGFHEYISCLLSIIIGVILFASIHTRKKLIIRKDILTSAIVAVCVGYGLSCFWAADKGMAFIGLVKILPVFLYLIYLQQQDRVADTVEVLPWFGAATVIVAGIGMQFPMGKELFSVAGRLAGFFQYPNTYAIFLLACELLALKKEDRKIWDYIALVVLVAGFLYTGSRTAFVVAILANVAMLFVWCQKRVRIGLLIGIAGVVLVAGLLALNKNSVLYRYLTISITESTFVGRLLYWVDALPLLLKHPLGMGYMGYYYTQQSIQTGVYSVLYIHNDLLQLLLDIGWMPVALLVIAFAKWFLKKTVSVADKVIVGAICLHSFFEFNLQYISVWFLLILLLSSDRTSKTMEVKSSKLHQTGLAAVIGISLYMGTALGLSHIGKHELADKLYPYNTQNKLHMLEQVEDLATAKSLADEMLEQNTSFYAPYSIYAKYYYSQGDFGAMIQNGRKALERNPFAHEEYETYCKMLITGIDLYTKAGNQQSAEICKQELLATAEQFSKNADKLSALGKMINDQPVLTLSREVQEYIRQIGA